MIQRTTVRLPSELLRRAKRKAAVEGRTLTALIEDGLRLVVSDESQKPKPRKAHIASIQHGDRRTDARCRHLQIRQRSRKSTISNTSSA